MRCLYLLCLLLLNTAYAASDPDAMWTYKSVDGKDLQMSVFLPDDYQSGKQFPTFVVFHGGSWNAGDASWHYPDCRYWATAMITSKATNDDVFDVAISCKPDAVILYNPWFKCQTDLSPTNFVAANLPPFITFLGEKDPTPVAALKTFHDSLKGAGNASEYYVGNGAGHGFCNGRNPRNRFFYWSLELEDQFLVKHGILKGPSKVKRPDGVPCLALGADYVAY
jgi:acetyl esterase/lipase